MKAHIQPTGVGSEAIITLERKRFWGLLSATSRSYRGSGTVWRSWPGGRRASTLTEGFLADLWTAWRWRYDSALSQPKTGE